MAVVMTRDLISDDLWTLPEAHADIRELQAKDFAKWLRKQVRQYGRKAIVGSIQTCPVEAWVKEVAGIDIAFICGGEIEIEGRMEYTDWTATAYYMMDEEGLMVVEAGRMLDIISLDNPEAYLIAR